MKLLNIKIDNFCGIKTAVIEFGKRTFINGVNGSGKSTVKKAIFWVLNAKDESGKEVTDIRPRNADGSEKNNKDISVELLIEVDGTEYSLKKVSRKEYTKQGEFKGNKVETFINDFPKRSTDYAEFMKEIIPDSACFNSKSFLALDTNSRRKKLIDVFGVDTESLLSSDKYAPIAPMLQTATADEAIKMYRGMIKGNRTISGFERELDLVVAKIKDLEQEASNKDVAEWELAKSSAEKELEKVEAELASLSSEVNKVNKLDRQLMDAQFSLGDVIRDISTEYAEKRNKAIKDREEARATLELLEINEEYAQKDLRYLHKEVGDMDLQIELRNQELEAVRSDTEPLICPTCGKEYDKEKADAIMSERVQKLQKEISDKYVALRKKAAEIDKKLQVIADLQVSILKAHTVTAKAEKNYAEVESARIDYESHPKYIEAQKRIDELTKQREMCDNNRAEELAEKRFELKGQIAEAENHIKETDVEAKIQALRNEQRDIAKKIANCNKTIDLLQEYKSEMIRRTEESINDHFGLVSFRMFETLQNGEQKDICTPCVDGISYDSNLNFAHRILAEIDISLAFQKAHGIELPIIVDEASSIDSWRLNQFDRQMIIISRSDDKEITTHKED